jgi:predicted nucleotidyltransferase
MDPVVQQIAKEYKAALQEIYGDDLAELILFGSYARGDQHEESDVDFAVVMKDPATRSFPILDKTSHLATDLYMKYGLIVSSLVVSLQKKQSSMLGVYQDIRKEGVII